MGSIGKLTRKGITLGSIGLIWDHCEITLESFWEHGGAALGSFGFTLRSYCNHFGIYLGKGGSINICLFSVPGHCAS